MSELAELDYVEGAGPGIPELPAFTAEDAAAAGAQQQQVLDAPPGWELEHINTFLTGLGSGLHMLVGEAENDWLMTKADLDRIAPPMQRIANRYQPTLAASTYADPLVVAYGFALYGWRSALERARALRDKQIALEEEGGARYERPGAAQAAEPAAQGEEDGGELIVGEHRPMFPSAAVPRMRR